MSWVVEYRLRGIPHMGIPQSEWRSTQRFRYRRGPWGAQRHMACQSASFMFFEWRVRRAALNRQEDS